MVDRAAVALDEDFRSGLDDWASRGDATTEWSFDATGFVRPGPLALYRPSMDLTDYQMQFLGMIDKKALSWVVRAADFDNYYVVKLVVLKPGPLPTIGVTRYAVINGKADTRVDTVAPIDARPDMLYRVRLDVHGDNFALYVQGQLIDTWTEPRLKRGGVGFFTARGEESRVRWVQVTHQYDMLGRLCAYLAPYNIPIDERELVTMSGRKNGTDTAAARRTEGGLAGAGALGLAASGRQAQRSPAGAEHGHRKRRGDAPKSCAAKGHIQFELEQFDDALKTYEKLLTRGAAASHRELQPGHLLREAGALAGSHRRLQKALDTDPQREEAQLGLGICLLHQEKPEPAIVCFDKVLARQPDHETALFGKAVSLQLLWKFDEATALYLKILEKNPQSEECLVNLITIGMARKDHDAIQQYSERLLTHAAVLAGGARRPGDLRVPLATITKRRRATAPSWWSSRRIISSAGSTWAWPNRSAAACRKPPKPIRKRCASVPTPSRRT